jgi:hypothetical protein
MFVYTVVIEDTVVQRREYITFGENERDAETHIRQGLFISESEPATVDTVATEVKSTEKIGVVHEG